MTRLGITGGIGSGKSHVAQMLRSYGIPVYDADAEAKRLTNTSPMIREQLMNIFGNNIYTDEGVLRKEILAKFVFNSPETLLLVNSIIHPVVRSDFRTWTARHSCPIVAIESAILFEAAFRDEVDCVLMVNAPEPLRIERVMKRDNVSREAIQSRIRVQMDEAEKLCLADFVINNDGRDLTLPIQEFVNLIKTTNKN